MLRRTTSLEDQVEREVAEVMSPVSSLANNSITAAALVGTQPKDRSEGIDLSRRSTCA